jgi:hypothetical protein
MAELEFSAEELLALWDTGPSLEGDELAALVGAAPLNANASAGELTEVPPTSAQSATAGASAQSATARTAEENYAWLDAVQLIPKFEKLIRNYPPITTTTDPKHGRVIVLAYIEDRARGVRRNFKVGNQMFFDLDELERIEPETKALKCRILIKIIPYQVGLKIRCWENRPGGDDPRKKGLIVAKEGGLAFEERPAVLVRGGK